MDSTALELAEYIHGRVGGQDSSQSRFVIGLAGIPASGKTTLAQCICKHINDIHRAQTGSIATTDIATVVGLDGWHLTRAQLSAMDDPKLAFDRRGAHWTFDAGSYLAFVKQLKDPNLALSTICAPSFDHALKDPVVDDIQVLPSHRVVIIEGLYVLLAVDEWEEAAGYLDERWLVDVDAEEARKRLVARHVRTGVASDETEAKWRAENNDMPNGLFMLARSVEATRRIESLDDANIQSS